jgi:hypothetical protein
VCCSQREALARVMNKWLDHLAEHPASDLRLTDLFSAENIAAVRALDLYPEHSPTAHARDLALLRAWTRPCRGRLQ